MNMKILSIVSSLAFLAVAFTSGCGSDGGGGPSQPDAASGQFQDAAPAPDAPPPPSHMGEPCTPDPVNDLGRGTCPTDYICLELQDSIAAYCTRRCTSLTDTICDRGYNGPGQGACIYRLQSVQVCGIICEDLTPDKTICPDCNGTCPAPLQCTDPIMGSGSGVTDAKACI